LVKGKDRLDGEAGGNKKFLITYLKGATTEDKKSPSFTIMTAEGVAGLDAL